MYRCLERDCLILFFLFGTGFYDSYFLIVPVIIKYDSEGAVFFSSKTDGVWWANIFLLKFRSMVSDKDGETKGFEPGASLRVTRVGRTEITTRRRQNQNNMI